MSENNVQNTAKKSEKEIQIEWNGKQQPVIIRRMGWAEKNDFLDQYVKMNITGTTQTIDVKLFGMRTASILKLIVKAPFPVNVATLNDPDIVDPSVIEKIAAEIDNFNKLEVETKKKLNSPSEEKKE